MNTGEVARFRDGAVKRLMVVPLIIQPSAEYPDGTCAWYVKGSNRDELTRAMKEAGVPLRPDGKMPPPEAGALISITYTGDRPVRNMNPQRLLQVTYQRPDGAVTAPANGTAQQPQQQFQPPQQQFQQPQPQFQPPQQQFAQQPQQVQQLPPGQFAEPTGPAQFGQPQFQQPPPQQQQQMPPPPPQQFIQQPPPQPPPQQFVQQPPPQAQFQPPQQQQMAIPSNLSPEKALLMAKLTGQTPPQ